MKSEPIEQRLARIESRIVQIMLHLGVDPYRKAYDNLESAKHDTATYPDPSGDSPAKDPGRSRSGKAD
jgi:hypothetical protein